MKRPAKAPTAPGLYWLLLDEGGSFTTDAPLLVRVSVLKPYGEGRIEFLDYPDRDPEKTSTPILDEPMGRGGASAGLRAFANGSLHDFRKQEVALWWAGPVKPPKVPAL